MRIHRAHWRCPDDARGGVVAIGNFDGVHRGHQALIETAATQARNLETPLGVVTFEPHPREVLTPDRAPPRITPLRAKARRLDRLGVAHLHVLAFTNDLRAKSPEAFITDVLVQGLGIRHVVVGHDFRFGNRRTGDIDTLRTEAARHGFGVTALEPVTFRGEVCSSSRIRAAVTEGDVTRAADLLGHPFTLEGRIVHGDQRGRDLGYPTANLQPHGRRPLLPAAGVYAVRAGVGRAHSLDLGAAGAGDSGAASPLSSAGRPIHQDWHEPLTWYDAVASLGHRPTFDGQTFKVEVHLFDFAADLYGQRLWCSFIQHLRPEERFASADALITQMHKDAANARAVLAATPPGSSGRSRSDAIG